MDYKDSAKIIFNNYIDRFPKASYCHAYKVKELNDKLINNAIKHYANTCHAEDVIGLVDNTVMQNGKVGILFTDNYMYFTRFMSSTVKLWYDEIKNIESIDDGLIITMRDDEVVTWIDSDYNLNIIKLYLEEIIILDNLNYIPTYEYDKVNLKDFSEGICGLSTAVDTYEVVNKLFEEEKFNAKQGHGFAAERANNLHDKMHGRKGKILGDNNVKNGPDRVVKINGQDVFIQSKYCATGKKCIDACFEEKGKGTFRYIYGDGKPMVIEVPLDKIDAAIATMEEKIKNGQVPNVTDPKEAKNIVKAGNFTYKQAVNIAKAGNIDSIIYDAEYAMVTSVSVFSVSTILTFANSIWNGESYDVALKKATFNGLKIGGTAFITSVLASQLSKAGLNSLLVGSSEAIAKALGYKASAVIINAFRNGVKIYGNAAMKSFAKLLRGNVIVNSLTVIILSSVDVVDIFRGRISGKQLFKNLLGNVATVGGGGAGWIAGAAAGTYILPGFGTIAGGLIGAFGVGYVAGKLVNFITGKFVEDDGNQMFEIVKEEFTKISMEYLLTKTEGEKIADLLVVTLNQKVLKNMYASKDRNNFAREILIDMCDKIIEKRKKIEIPECNAVNETMVEILQELEKGDKKVEN